MSARDDDPPRDAPREPPPPGVRSTPGRAPGPASPVPVRDLMKPAPARAEPGAEETAGPGEEAVVEHAFEREGETWIARAAGSGAYGTGRAGAARLMAVHFHRAAEPARPLREALIAAGAFAGLAPDELRTLCDRATPIPQER